MPERATPRTGSERQSKAGPISNVVCPGCKRSLDDVIESLIRQRGKFKGQREQMRRERDEARREAEVLAEALEVVIAYLRTDERRPLHTTIGKTCGVDICIVCSAEGTAREALDEFRSRHPRPTT